jgi:hypothetical protein
VQLCNDFGAIDHEALLGYLVGLFSSKFNLRPRVEHRFLLPESEEVARARYRAAWWKYLTLRLEFSLSIPGWFVFSSLNAYSEARAAL